MAGKQKKNYSRKIAVTLVICVVVAAIGLGLFAATKRNSSATSTGPTTTVKQGPLTIAVTEGGTLEAHNQLILKDKVRGSRTIIYLIDEGTHVQKGDLLVQLDASD